MYQIVVCPKHKKALVFYKDTDTHSLFKCPDCDYVDYPGVVHRDLPEKYMNLKAENKRLREKFIEFGQHDAGCLAKHKHGKCSCGFEQALREK